MSQVDIAAPADNAAALAAALTGSLGQPAWPANAKGDYASSTGASVAASSSAFSNSGGVTFNTADVGKVIVIDGAGAGGAALVTTIDAINGANATLHAAATAAVPAQYVSGASVVTSQSGGGSYVPGDTITPSGGTAAITGILTVSTTKVVGATVNAGGSGGTNGTQTVYGTTGTGSKFQASVTVSGGAITAVGSISLAGNYSANPTDITQEPVTGAGLTGAKLALTMGVLSASVSTPGNYSVAPGNPVSQASTSGSGTGATFNLSFTASGAWAYATDDTAAIAAATSPMFLPLGKSYYTTTAVSSFGLKTTGQGSIRDSSRRAQAPNFIGQTAAPASFGSTGFVGSAFTGDLSRLAGANGKQISGSTTLGQPSSGYSISPENSINYNYISNSSGFNSSTSGNGGRTGAAAHYVKADSIGQGDTYCYYANGFVSGAKPGATSFLANPAVVLFAGSCSPGQDGVYLNPVEISNSDSGRDVAAINFVANQNRSNDLGALGAVWFGYRSQSSGSVPIDAHFSASGKSKIGIDLTNLATNASGTWAKAAMTLLGGDRIYFNASAGATSPGYASTPGSSYLYYDTSNNGLEAVVGGSAAFLFTSGSAFVYNPLTVGASQNNRLLITGAASGSAVAVTTTGTSDANVDMDLTPKGTGLVKATGLLMRQGVGTSRTPTANGDLTFEFTSNTSVTVRGRGSDGTTRTSTITLS